MKIFRLSKYHLDLAKDEVLAQADTNNCMIEDNLLILNAPELHDRLGMTHDIYDFLFKIHQRSLFDKARAFDWSKIYKKSLCVRAHGVDQTVELELADIIYNKLGDAKVDLVNPLTRIDFFFVDDQVVVGKFDKEVDKTFLERKAHLRPSLHPTSIQPAISRACINLTGLKKGRIIDPFCGSGGILIEAGLMGFEITGGDIVKEQVERAKVNLAHYGLKGNISHMDALKVVEKADAIVTDFPYGKSSKASKIPELYSDFLDIAPRIADRAVVIFPDFVDYRKILKKWSLRSEYRIYVHKSLSRIITRLDYISK